VRRDVDTDGLSLSLVDSDEDRRLVIVARACEALSDGALDFIEADGSLVEEVGTVLPSQGTTPFARANELHRSLDWQQPDLDRLAGRLYDANVPAMKWSSTEIRAAILDHPLPETADEEVRAFVAAVRRRAETGGR
jgi:hypothetical protein